MSKEGDVQIYRRAAADSLELVDWCIGYLHGIHKNEISRALARNRSHIRSLLLEAEAEPDEATDQDQELPSEETAQV